MASLSHNVQVATCCGLRLVVVAVQAMGSRCRHFCMHGGSRLHLIMVAIEIEVEKVPERNLSSHHVLQTCHLTSRYLWDRGTYAS